MNLTAESALDNGKYILDTPMGQGVFGITYRATNMESGQTVVIKTLAESLRQHPDFVRFKQQFLEFAERASRCKHPNLVQVLDWFEDAGCPYLVMEYIPGQTLAEVIQANMLSEAKTIEYIRQIGNALSVLHRNGLLHQDVKPQNIIRLQNTDCVVLCEFGITCEFAPGVMQTHATLVSAGYAPLEQYTFEEQRTPATDIYALAATLYCLLTGRSPSPAPVRVSEAVATLGASALHSDEDKRFFLLDLRQSTHTISPAVKQALLRGLEIDASHRPQTIESWLSQLKSQEKILTDIPRSPASPVTPPQQGSVRADVKPAPANNQNPQVRTRQQEPTSHAAVDSVRRSHSYVSVSEARRSLASRRLGASALLQAADRSPATQPKASSVPPLPQNSAQVNIKRTPTQRSTSGLPTRQRNSIPQPAVARHPVNTPKTQEEPKGFASPRSHLSKGRWLWRALLMTGAIAASAGVGFGFALRINAPNEPGSTFLHTKQSFPPSRNWPVSDPHADPATKG